MSLCVQEDWISGLWLVFAGLSLVVSAFASILAVEPLLAR